MRRTILALAAVLATGCLAMANGTHTKSSHAPTTCGKTKSGQNLDCGSTGSIKQDRGPQTTNSTRTSEKPRLGIDIDPWIMPTIN